MNAEPQFRFGVLAGGAILVGIIVYLRFCGSLSLPPKPPAPSEPSGTQQQLLARSTGSPAVYQTFLQNDAATAGVQAPSIEEMSRKFAYRVDEARHVLELGKPPIELAGLRLHLERTNDQVVLVIKNVTESEIAYEVSTQPSVPTSTCMRAGPLPYNAMVIGKGATATRTECIWRDGLSIIVTKTETMEIPPLSGWYLSQIPPALVGVEDRLARGHRGGSSKATCTSVLGAAVRGAMDRGDIGWRDLADFYARHRCQTYQFSSSYRAFKSDGERGLPAVDASL
jgi:hypothetical protein